MSLPLPHWGAHREVYSGDVEEDLLPGGGPVEVSRMLGWFRELGVVRVGGVFAQSPDWFLRCGMPGVRNAGFW